jgi:hypothetical protein
VDDLYNILGVSEDDIVIDLRYGVICVLREGILDLSEVWVHRPLIEWFSSYTYQNAIRIYRLTIAHDDCLVFDLQLVDPDVAIQEVVDDISSVLSERLPWPPVLEVEHPWREVRICTIGDPASVEQELTAYIEAVRRSKPEDDG